MRILFYCDTVFNVGGVQRVLAEIAKALCTSHEVVILTNDCHTDLSMYDYKESTVEFDYISYDDAPPRIEYLLCKFYSFIYKKCIPQTQCFSELYSKTFFLPIYKKHLIAKINAGHYDLVVAVHAFCALHLAAVCDRITAGTIGWMHNSYHAFFEKDHPYLPHLKNFFQWQMGKLNRIVVLSQDDCKCYLQKMNLKTEVIYNPLTVLPKGKGAMEYKKFLAVGRFSSGHKGFDLLIKAFSVFVKTHQDWTLEIVGEGPEEQLYRSLIHDYKLEESIQLHPFTKDVQSHYAHSSIYVLSSRWEGFGLVMLEAMAHGLPVIASDLPITRELLKDRGVAVFFEKENISQLVGCMEYMADEADLAMMGKKALAYAETFSIEKIGTNWNRLLKTVADGTR